MPDSVVPSPTPTENHVLDGAPATMALPSDVLREYAHLKLELGGIVRSLLHAAEQRHDDISVQDCRRLLARLAEDRFNLAVVGQFSRGKSSLMNALLGSEKLPTGVLPLTSVITTVSYGETERALLQREGWSLPQEITLDQLPEYVTQSQNPGNEKHVILAEVQLPHELLRMGVHFIDTPGIASAIAANTKTTRRFLPEIDAAILVTSFESPMAEPEIRFLRELHEHVRSMFIVVNKLDLAGDDERQAVLGSVAETAQQIFPDAKARIFAISAKLALRGKKNHSPEEITQSGILALEDALSTFLEKDKAREFLLRAADRARRIARQQEQSVSISERARNPEDAAVIERRVDELSTGISHDREMMTFSMRRRLPHLFCERCAAIAPLWTGVDEALLGREIEGWLSRENGGMPGNTFQDFLTSRLQQVVENWQFLHRNHIERIFQELTSGESRAIEGLARRIDDLAASVLGMNTDASLARPLDSHRLAFPELDLSLAEVAVPWWYELMPPGRFRNYLVRRWCGHTEFGAIYRQAVSESLGAGMTEWIGAVDSDLERRTERAEKHIADLLHQEPASADLVEIRQLIDRVHDFERAVSSPGTTISQGEPRTFAHLTGSENRPAARPCSICLRIERTLDEFMAHRQYELSISESEQRSHALRLGFCPLHTWQYEAISSPQGVCASYAALLILYATRMRLLAQDCASVEAMSAGIRLILPTSKSCEACQLIASTENAASHEQARQLGTKDDQPSLCAFHLRAVLAANPDLKTAAALLLREASIFDRLAEDMRSHVLKHEAQRRNLSTNAERDAATAGLALLVGTPNLVGARRIE